MTFSLFLESNFTVLRLDLEKYSSPSLILPTFRDRLPTGRVLQQILNRDPNRLFYHLVGTAEQCGRDSDAESLCGLEVDEQVNFRGLLDR